MLFQGSLQPFGPLYKEKIFCVAVPLSVCLVVVLVEVIDLWWCCGWKSICGDNEMVVVVVVVTFFIRLAVGIVVEMVLLSVCCMVMVVVKVVVVA